MSTLPFTLGPLFARYIRGDEGAVEVLGDALLEHGREPLPPLTETEARFDRVIAILSRRARTKIGCGGVPRVIGHFEKERPDERILFEALDVLEEGDEDL